MKHLLKLWHQWRLRRAQEKYAVWKAKHAEYQRQLDSRDYAFSTNPYNRHLAIRAAGREALYLERVEQLMRVNHE